MVEFDSKHLYAILVLMTLFSFNTELILTSDTNEFVSIGNTITNQPERIMNLADSTQSFSFSLSDNDYEIKVSDYSKTHEDIEYFYKLSFSVSGGSLEFFMCSESVANLWSAGMTVYIPAQSYWASTSGETVTRTVHTIGRNPIAFVFNHEGTGTLSVSGSIVVDTSPPSLYSTLTNNATYNETVEITTVASDAVSGLDSIKMYIDGIKITESSSSPFSYTWNTQTLSNGLHVIQINATDNAGHVKTLTLEVWVNNSGFDPSFLWSYPAILVYGIGFVIIASYWWKVIYSKRVNKKIFVRAPKEPKVTSKILSGIPDTLREMLRDASDKISILISSNGLRNRFILERLKFRPSQRRRFRNLFSSVGKEARTILQHYLDLSRIEWEEDGIKYIFGIYKFEELQGNIILRFTPIPPESD